MKKLFVCALAASMFTACSQDETISQQSPMQISFDGAFVENATRAAVDPSITNEDGENPIADFDVWGFMDEASGVVFNREKVTKNGSDWSYVNTQYWLPKHTYYFAAVAPAQSNNISVTTPNDETAEFGLGTISFTNADGGEDLLYAAVAAPITTGDKIEAQPDPVKFTFNHMLSKVKFTFKNGFTNTNSTIKISDVTMTAPASGSINVAQENWWSTNQWVLTEGQENALTLKFGNAKGTKDLTLTATASDECELERLTIPADKTQKYVVKFHVELYQGDVLAIEGERTAEITGVALEIAKAYNFTAELNASNLTDDVTENPLFPITFEVTEVKEWDDVDNSALQTVLTEKEIADLTLVSDATSEVPVTITNRLDGAGHTFSASVHNTQKYQVGETLRLFTAKGENVKISNLEINGCNIKNDVEKKYGIRAIYMEGEGNFIIDNVNIHHVAYTINDDKAAKTLKVTNSTFEGWTSYNADATFENVNFTVGSFYAAPANTYSNNDNGHLRPYGNTTLKNCTFAKDYWVDMQELTKKNKTIKFDNCTYNGTLITKDNIATLNFIENYDANVVVW